MRARERVVLPDFRRRAVVQDHVHLCQRPGGVVHSPGRRSQDRVRSRSWLRRGPSAAASRSRRSDRRWSGRAALCATDADDLGHDARNFRRRVELPLALARLGGEVAHQVFVGVAEEVVALGAVAAEIQLRVVEDRDQVGEPIHHLLALAQLCRIVEVGLIDHALEVVGLGELGDDLVDLVADLLVALERDHVGEAAALGDLDQRVFLARVFVGDVLHEQQDEDVVLVLRGVHAAAQLVAAFPEGAVEFGFLDGHVISCWT